MSYLDIKHDPTVGGPGQTVTDWQRDLDTAIALAPDHVSCYPLELRLDPEASVANWPGGGWPVLERWRQRTVAAQPDDVGIARLYRLAEGVLGRSGYRHYEIANWARPRKRSLHNLGYWRDRDWLGVGMGAHTHLGGVRSANPVELRTYIAHARSGSARAADLESDPRTEAAMLALRLDTGLDLRRYGIRFGDEAASRVRLALAEVSRARLVRWSGDRASLTARGRLLASGGFVRLPPQGHPFQRELAAV